MERPRVGSAPRRVPVLLGLALFLAGTNYCLVGVIASSLGARGVACHADVPEPAEASGCCHADSPAQAPDSPVAAPDAPCCIAALAPAVGPQAHEAPVSLSALTAPAPESFAAPALDRAAARPKPNETPPHEFRSQTPLSNRAPPLA
jgi:hypothetical protein